MRVSGFSLGGGEFGNQVDLLEGRLRVVHGLQFGRRGLGEVASVAGVPLVVLLDLRDGVTAWNENPKPFIWTKTAEQILEPIGRLLKRINGAGHEPFTAQCSPTKRLPVTVTGAILM